MLILRKLLENGSWWICMINEVLLSFLFSYLSNRIHLASLIKDYIKQSQVIVIKPCLPSVRCQEARHIDVAQGSDVHHLCALQGEHWHHGGHQPPGMEDQVRPQLSLPPPSSWLPLLMICNLTIIVVTVKKCGVGIAFIWDIYSRYWLLALLKNTCFSPVTCVRKRSCTFISIVLM